MLLEEGQEIRRKLRKFNEASAQKKIILTNDALCHKKRNQ